MKTKTQTHTPGPWTVDEDNKVWGKAECCDGPKCDMCRVPVASSLAEDSDMEEADARLIAAAPELLEVAIMATSHSCSTFECGDDLLHCPVRHHAREAVAKAKGGK